MSLFKIKHSKTNNFKKKEFIMLCFCFPFLHGKKSQCPSTKKRHFPTPSLKSLSASFTVEAAVVMPVLICAVAFILIFFRIMAIEWGLAVGNTDVARQVAIYGETGESTESVVTGVLGKEGLVAAASSKVSGNNVPVKFITNGSTGISFLGSNVSDTDVEIISCYDVNSVVALFGKQTFNIFQKTKMRRWVGYDPKEESDSGEYVYVTRTGTAYHRNVNCTYLDPSVSAVSATQVDAKRNESGGKYHACDRCKPNKEGLLYITEYGDVYHSSVTCSSLRRSIQRILLEEAGAYHACSKCGG